MINDPAYIFKLMSTFLGWSMYFALIPEVWKTCQGSAEESDQDLCTGKKEVRRQREEGGDGIYFSFSIIDMQKC